MNELLEKGVACAPCHVFQIAAFAFGFSRRYFRSHEKLQLELRGKFRNEFLVGIRGSAAQFVIEVHHGKNETQFSLQFKKQCSRATESAPPETATPKRWPAAAQ